MSASENNSIKQITTSINHPFKVENNKPIDIRFVISELNELKNESGAIPKWSRYPGLIFFSVKEKKLFVFYQDAETEELQYTEIGTALHSVSNRITKIEGNNLIEIDSKLSKVETGEVVYLDAYQITLQSTTEGFVGINNGQIKKFPSVSDFNQINKSWLNIGDLVQISDSSDPTELKQINRQKELEPYKFSSNTERPQLPNVIDGKIYVLSDGVYIAYSGVLYKFGHKQYSEVFNLNADELYSGFGGTCVWKTIQHNLNLTTTEQRLNVVCYLEDLGKTVDIEWEIVDSNSIRVLCCVMGINVRVVVSTIDVGL